MRTKGFCRTMAMLSGALMLTMPAQAQADKDAKAGPPDEIVVTGKVEQPPAEVRKQALSITQKAGPVYRTPLAQFQDPVCPGILGMPRNIAEIMVDRIRYNAEKIGLDVAREGKCQPNIVVAFVLNGQKEIKRLKDKQGYIFKNIDYHELKKMAADSGPVHAWVNTIVKSRQGDVLQGDNEGDLTQIPTLNVAQSQSHIFLATRLDITNSIIMIDIPAVNGMSAVQLADYVTMRTFARTRPVSGEAAVGTILSLFDAGSEKPRELTDFDIAYLRSIYGGIPNLNAASKLARINKNLREQQAERAADE
jgi:hypothetical protein